MSKKFLTIIFLISVAFNFAFIGTFVYLHFFKMGPIPNHPNFVGQVPPPVRMEMFNHKKVLKPVHEEFQDSKRHFFESLRSKNFDPENSKELLTETIEKQMIMERKLGELMIETRDNLSEAELEKFLSERRNRFKEKKPRRK